MVDLTGQNWPTDNGSTNNRLRLLEFVLNSLRDKIYILDEDANIVFLNKAASDYIKEKSAEPLLSDSGQEVGRRKFKIEIANTPDPGWCDQTIPFEWDQLYYWARREHLVLGTSIFHELETANSKRLFLHGYNGDIVASDLQINAIREEEVTKQPKFLIGEHDISALYESLYWFRQWMMDVDTVHSQLPVAEWRTGLRNSERVIFVARKILSFFEERMKCKWGRLYLHHNDPAQGPVLFGFEEFGLHGDNQRVFREETLFAASQSMSWHIFRESKHKIAAIYVEDATYHEEEPERIKDANGYPRYRCRKTAWPQELERDGVTEWIDSGLFIGDFPVCSISIGMPQIQMTPGLWELMKIAMQTAAVILQREILDEERRRSVKAEKDMLTDVRHAFRSPSAALKKILDKVPVLSSLSPEDFGRIKECSARLNKASLEYKIFTKYDRADSRINMQLLDIVPMFAGLCEFLQQTYEPVKITFHSVSESVLCETDEDRLNWCLDEVIVNAVSAGADVIAVKVTRNLESKRIEIIVEDDGPGIGEEMIPALFELGKTGGDGVGFGLANRRTLMRNLGGDLEFLSSTIGQTKFLLWLPSFGE